MYASGERDRDRDGESSQPSHKGLPQLPYSSVGVNLRSGRHRVKEDSRANYADVVEVDHEAQVMVVGDVAKYFDRVRKNVNKAFMRQVLREALGPYCERKKSESAAAGVRGWGNSTASLTKVSNNDVDQEHLQGDQDEGGESAKPSGASGEIRVGSLEKEVDDYLSDTTRDEDDWDGSQQSPFASPQPSDDRRAMRSAFRARTQGETTGVKPGMDKAGLSSLRSLRQGLPGNDDHDDTRSLRSLAMVGRSDSYESRKSRR